MAVAPGNLEWSLAIPSVKELIAGDQLVSVPPRYVRDDVVVDYPFAADPSNYPSPRVPLIDMAELVDPEHSEVEIQKLHAACRDWGLFQLINHGVSSELIREMKKKTQGFFDLPLQVKELYARKPGSLEGYGQHFVKSEDQKLEWCDLFFLKTLPTQVRSLELWPEHPPNYRETIGSYSEDMRKVAVSMVGFIAKGLGFDAEELSKAYQFGGKYEMRLNYYPPCPQPEKVLGVASHTDTTGITLLLDCGEMPAAAGLQVLKDGQWVPVKPMDDSIVVNIGNILEIMSNGIYKAPYHRAVVDRWKERLSIATFCYPNSDVIIGPAKELTNLPLYKTLTQEDYFWRFFNWKLDGVPFIDTLKI